MLIALRRLYGFLAYYILFILFRVTARFCFRLCDAFLPEVCLKQMRAQTPSGPLVISRFWMVFVNLPG